MLHQAWGTSGKLPLLSEAPKLFCFCAIISHYITIISIIFSIIGIISKQKIAIWVGIYCNKQANRIIHDGGSLFEASSSSIDSIGEHQHVFSYRRAGSVRGVLWVGATDVCKPSGTQGRTKRIAQGINRLGNCSPLVLPHVIRYSKVLTNL